MQTRERQIELARKLLKTGTLAPDLVEVLEKQFPELKDEHKEDNQ